MNGLAFQSASSIATAAELSDIQSRMLALGYSLDFRSGEQFRALIVRDYQRCGRIIREAGIVPN
jgi:tripartite-type tricarboxylate transporter receptor subunit TctC